ncbi:uncharacterized protein LOC132264126 [Phlebotomus argentipes]|uniref:uncharacterized protein LOC132264126 n=1 Tax=Phlebotomus argentipes TaxID=94469 RepID=UPI002892A4DC|nr:uncharacterized protein LOC132264126 [Phlebotomus argentipes]
MMYSTRNEIVLELKGDPQEQRGAGQRQNRPNGAQAKRRNVSNEHNMANGGNKRRFQCNPSNAPNRRGYQNRHQDLSPVIEISVDERNNKRASYAGTGRQQGSSGARVPTEATRDEQMQTPKFHHQQHYNRGQYHGRGPHYQHRDGGRGPSRATAEHRLHCNGWGSCTCVFPKPQWSGQQQDYSRAHNRYADQQINNSRSPTPSLKSESPPAMTPTLNSPILPNALELTQLMTISKEAQLPSRNGYESDCSQQVQAFVPTNDFFFDFSSNSYQLGDVMQHPMRCVTSSQSSLSSGNTDESSSTSAGYTYELMPYVNHNGSYNYIFPEPTPLINHEMDGYLRKKFSGLVSPPENRRGVNSGMQHRRKRFVETPPDHFIARAHLVMTKTMPKALLTGGQWDNLSQMVWNRFMVAQQSEETYVKKMNLWKSLFIDIRTAYPSVGLYLVGSTMTGFGADASDVDMCLVAKSRIDMEPRMEAIVTLSGLQNFLAMNKKYEMFHLIEAKVPILRFRDAENHIEVDLNYNNCVGIRNTNLLYWYSNMDWRVRPLVLVVKMWAQHHCINNAKNSTISSYSLVLMVIHFLQVGVNPIILPCLHDMHPEKFNVTRDLRTININEQMKSFISANQQTLGELFLQFLRYYSTFDYSQYAISVRTASCLSIDFCRMQRSPKNDPHQWKHLCIEEPFDLTNTARSVYDSDVFEKIKFIFLLSWRTLEATMDLNAIFKPLYGYPFHSMINQ